MTKLEDITGYLSAVEQPPVLGSPNFHNWIEGRDILPFLWISTIGDVPVYLSQPHAAVYSALVPLERLLVTIAAI